MADQQSLIMFLAHTDNLSVEFSRHVMNPFEVKAYLAKFDSITVPTSCVIQSYVKMTNNEMAMVKVFESNEITQFAEQVSTMNLDSTTKLFSKKVITLEANKAAPQSFERAEVVTQFTFALSNNPDWVLQVRLVKSLTNPLEFATQLPVIKSMLVNVELESMSSDAYDSVLTSLVRVSNETVAPAQLLELIESVSRLDSYRANERYQSIVYALAKDIYRDVAMVKQFKRQSGFKRLCSNAVELNRSIYFKQVRPVIDTFYITDKMDGIRAMLVIDEVYSRVGQTRNLLGAHIFALSDQIYKISSVALPPRSSSSSLEMEHTVLDVEMMTDANDVRTFHCFDVITIASRRVAGLPFKRRFGHFDRADQLLKKYNLGSTKQFIRLTKKDFGKQIKAFYETKRKYHIDGIIFTPEGVSYKEAAKAQVNKHDRIFNTEYANTISFKWKPIYQLTIDFYLMSHPTQKSAFILCSGVDERTFKRFRLAFFSGYTAPQSPNEFKYFPIQFEPSIGSFDYIWVPTKKEQQEFDIKAGKVGEFRFADTNGRLAKPQMIRLRDDREQDIAKGEYYGNALRYAELIWGSIQNPLTIEAVCDASSTSGYFAVNDDEGWFRASRNFNSFVKSYLLEKYLYAKTSGGHARIMDIAAGKGQDLARIVNTGYDEVIAVDKDIDALSELLERKYSLYIKSKTASANVLVKQMDLEDSCESNIKKLKLPKQTVDSIQINFAIHYICHSAGAEQKSDPICEFAKLCKYYLKAGGRVLITSFSGEEVFNLLKDKDEWTLIERDRMKYSIKKAFSSESLTNMDQAIEVLLPFSNGNYYREYLVNFKYVEQVFVSEGFKLVKTASFASLLHEFNKTNHRGYKFMTSKDKAYVSLYGYLIFE